MTACLPYDLIATDLDGTLARSDHSVSDRTMAAIGSAVAAGARHVVVTGRAAQWARPVLDEIGYTGLAVCGNGGQLYDVGEHTLLTSVSLDRDTAALALARAEALVGPLALAVTPDRLDAQVLVGPGYRMYEATEPMSKRVGDPDELWADPISRVFVQHPTLGDDELTAAVQEAAGDLVTVVLAGRECIEILPRGLSKATGLARAAQALGATAERTIAFGDMPNDIPMFGWAGHAVAMDNAHAELKAVADEVTSSNDEDGIAAVLEQWLPR
ncbi:MULTISPECIES: Cof-type HAD-IIB family hydrolase [unclassified Streptomyces]|uniref:Cof-type HAD-IIB family hydrolase n=1 Tax=unclassified Streptomyces TaxID=2593676 RepID=UPI000DC79A7A|nr:MULTISPECIES: Cof-type HAD-IIB family hydrolase [unclassified Streptomyces]AWZ17324.1 hydrolase [Streptomyces sp. ICC1]